MTINELKNSFRAVFDKQISTSLHEIRRVFEVAKHLGWRTGDLYTSEILRID